MIGTDAEATDDLYTAQWPVATAWVLGAEGDMRRLTREKLRPAGDHPDARLGAKPERVGGDRRLPV